MSQKQHLVKGRMEIFVQELWMFKSRICNSVFAMRFNSVEFKFVRQRWVKSTQAKAVFHSPKELTLTYCFSRSQFPIVNRTTVSHFSFSNLGVGVQLDYSVIQVCTSSLFGNAEKQKVKWLGIFGILPTLERFVPININLPWLTDTLFLMIFQNSKLCGFDHLSVCKFAIDIRLTGNTTLFIVGDFISSFQKIF